MTYHIDIQNATGKLLPLSEDEITKLASLALRDHKQDAELTVRLVDVEEMTYLNHTYRKKNKPTNVLAFPCSLPENIELECPLLGDVVICPEVLLAESTQFNKSLHAHWSLILIHGVLHLLGYDHIKDEEASIMQMLEAKLLAELGYANPYEVEENELE
ncbi:TPA: rRNA maturation RNase YbeY [Legionella pneumophila]|nr:rRNA maturation RNase YbeY [Legionella pneumophila]HAU0772449.1 rRNA maturation RNase YbeY [Legionella pneumophila]HAU0872127.1 rRNA maturation RNase YbeY [Legionella pneumophila]HAU1226534.1 rRNA maturation RNase YbeY [Legionella pneumophila]HCD9490833.1 rRNA maturation RNase YbeY [Legionella pneumophila]